MRNLSIDIETYSDRDLSKCGVYKYAESPDFEILLFGYSADGGDVRIIDLANGETLPEGPVVVASLSPIIPGSPAPLAYWPRVASVATVKDALQKIFSDC